MLTPVIIAMVGSLNNYNNTVLLQSYKVVKITIRKTMHIQIALDKKSKRSKNYIIVASTAVQRYSGNALWYSAGT